MLYNIDNKEYSQVCTTLSSPIASTCRSNPGQADKDHAKLMAFVNRHFTVVCSVTWPLNDREAGNDLVLIQTSLLLLCKSIVSYAN